jgi:hypothetical protein
MMLESCRCSLVLLLLCCWELEKERIVLLPSVCCLVALLPQGANGMISASSPDFVSRRHRHRGIAPRASSTAFIFRPLVSPLGPTGRLSLIKDVEVSAADIQPAGPVGKLRGLLKDAMDKEAITE